MTMASLALPSLNSLTISPLHSLKAPSLNTSFPSISTFRRPSTFTPLRFQCVVIRMQAGEEDFELKQMRDMAAAKKRWDAMIREGKVKILTPREAGYAIQLSNKPLLDVRPTSERKKARVKGSTWVPIFEVNNEFDVGTLSRKVTNFVMGGWWSGVPTLSYDRQFLSKVEEKFAKDAELIVACQKGLRSLAACELLSNAGYKNLFWVQGGLEAAEEEARKQKIVSDEEDDDEDYEEEKEEEEEDDDEEFTLDEEDCLDEEEDLTMKKKKNNMKASEQGLRKKRKKSAVSKKPLRKGGRKKRRLKTKQRVEEEDDDDDCVFTEKALIVRKKSRANEGRRKKAYVVLSDSDFMLSGSSDYEHTISEEEREQVKEASQFCGSIKTSLRSSSSSKGIQEVEELGQRTKSLGRKGKEKLEQTKAEAIKPVCGICLSEEDKRRLRGKLNCCSHYFCFTCIMEWSKVESRCPLCKQRFETISKPARSTAGVDLRDVVIQVPKRDQVYQPSEEELRSYLDPYENVICSECNQGGVDELMLLCDICDSSAHTYCVGLGWEVPEGNWYCNGCWPVALGSSSSQVQDSLPDQRATNNLFNRLSPVINVGESVDSVVVPSPRTPLPPGFVGLSSPRFPVVDIPSVSPVSGVGAPTLTGRRWLHRQIQNLHSINRMNLMAGRTDGISTVNTGIDFVNSHIDQSRLTTFQQARTQDMGTQRQTVFEERLQNDLSSSLQSRDFFSLRLGHLRRQAVQDSTATTFSTSVNLMLWPEIAGFSSNEQLHQCSNGSNIGPDVCGSPFPVRNEDNSSMAKEQLQGIVRSQLKALSNDTDLDIGTFSDIATSSMHTVLAACGLEHRRSEVHVVPVPSNCTHVERVAAGQASLMKGCCLTCFDSFVKDVVKRIMDTRSRQWLSLGL